MKEATSLACLEEPEPPEPDHFQAEHPQESEGGQADNSMTNGGKLRMLDRCPRTTVIHQIPSEQRCGSIRAQRDLVRHRPRPRSVTRVMECQWKPQKERRPGRLVSITVF